MIIVPESDIDKTAHPDRSAGSFVVSGWATWVSLSILASGVAPGAE